MNIKTSRLSRPQLSHRAARRVTSLSSLMLLAGVWLAPAFTLAQPPSFPYSGKVTPITLDDPLTEGMRLDTQFGLTFTVPPAPQRVAISAEFLALKYANGVVFSMDVLTQSAFELTADQPSLHEIFTRFFSGEALPRNKLDADAARFIEGFFGAVGSDILGDVSHWQHGMLDVYIFKLPALGASLGDHPRAQVCRALILNKRNKKNVIRMEALRRPTNSLGQTYTSGPISCDSIKSVVATVVNRVH